jgi:hypothetical protein
MYGQLDLEEISIHQKELLIFMNFGVRNFIMKSNIKETNFGV